MSKPSPQTISRPISPKFPPLNLAVNKVERVVLNALTMPRGFAAGYLRHRANAIVLRTSRSTFLHRMVSAHADRLLYTWAFQGGTRCPQRVDYATRLCRRISARSANQRVSLRTSRSTFAPVVSRFAESAPSSSRGRQNTSAYFAETDAVTISLTPTGDR